jgi:Stage II sporulation protein E (SpoIIE)
VAPFHPLRHDARAFTARAGAALAVFFAIAIVLLAGGSDQPLDVAEANKGDTGDGTAAVTAQTQAPTAEAPAPEPVLGAVPPAPEAAPAPEVAPAPEAAPVPEAAPEPAAAPAPETPAASQSAPAPASKTAPASEPASAPEPPDVELQPSVGVRSHDGGDEDDDDDGGDRGGWSHDDDDEDHGGWNGDDDDDGGWSGGGKGDDDDDDGWSGGGNGRGDDDHDDDDGWSGGDDDDGGRADDDDDGWSSGGKGGGSSWPSGGGKGGDDDGDDGDDDEPAPSGRGQVVTPPTNASTQTPGSTGGETPADPGQGQAVGEGTGRLRDQGSRPGEAPPDQSSQQRQQLTTGGNGGAGEGPGAGNGSGGTPAGETTGSDFDPGATSAPAPGGDTAGGAEGGAGGEAGAGGDGDGGAGGGDGQNDREQGAAQEEDNGPTDVAQRIVRDTLEVVPDSIKAALAALAALSILLGSAYLLAALRARRLASQRKELLQEVGLLQTALLPPVPDKVGALLTSVAYRPADGPGAGGDFYDVLPLPGGRVGFILGDVSGHGRGALARTAFMRYTLRAYLEAGLEPRVALQVAGRVIDENLGGDFATVLLAVHDPETGSLTYATAGHPAPIVVGPQPHEPVTAGSSPPIGVGVRTGLRQTTVPLVPGSVAALFTDGLMEARTENGILGRKRLEELLDEIGDDPTAHRLIDRVAAESTLLSDDMAAVVVTPTAGVTAGLFRTEQLELSARELDGPIARRFLEATGLPEADVDEAEREARELADRFGGVVLHVVFGNRLSVEVLPRNVESIEAASRRVSAGSGG